MVIRAARPDDLAAIENVIAAAFNEQVEGRTVRLVRSLNATGATRVSQVAEDDGVIVGHVQLSRAWLDTRRRLVEVLYLSPLSVSPSHQRRGIGTRLLAAATQRADELGAPALFLEGDWDYYGKRGFRSGSELGFVAPSVRIPGPAFQVVTLSTYESWMTGSVVYCEAFWEHDLVGLRDPRLARIEEHLREAVEESLP
jgi:putative acetyltransferase